MDNINYSDKAMASAGLPHDAIKWNDMAGQPFGAAARFNVIVFDDANNIVDVEGPVAIGGNFYSPRGLSVGYVRKGNKPVNYSPDLVRFLVDGNISMTGPLVVIGHVVGGSGFRAAKGSTYLIGKDRMTDGMQELKTLYQANGGSQYWTPSDKGDHYVIPSYDVPRYIPANRIKADTSRFFSDARKSIEHYKSCIEKLNPNGRVVDNNHEWILRGNDPVQNVFLIDVRPNGLINKGIRAEVPQGSNVIVRLRTGANAHLQYGVYGERSKTNQTLYVFEDASNIYMEKSSDIWGSILAPQAMFHAHKTGGHVSGNAALGTFAVNAESGFEFHYYPFVGGVMCKTTPRPITPIPVIPKPTPKPVPVEPIPVVPEPVPMEPIPIVPEPAPVPVEPIPVVPTPAPAPIEPRECPVCPVPEPCPRPEPCPVAPPCPKPEPCPVAPPCPKPEPCPTCPPPKPCPKPAPCPTCPKPAPCPACPVPPPCPRPKPCPVCPPCPLPKPCPVCEECRIKAGIIRGCIKGCYCGNSHEWDVSLYERHNDVDTLIDCVTICGCGYFEFKVPFEGCYVLKIRMANNCCKTILCKSFRCRPIVVLKNIGVEGLTME